MTDAIQLMLTVIAENTPQSIWHGAPLEAFRRVANTNRGDIGEEFLCRYLVAHGVGVTKSASRIQEWDLMIGGKRFEVKTASEDSTGGFQFNHIRLDRAYQFLLCLAVRPNDILFGAWRKGVVSEGGAGTLVRMAEGQSITFKLSRRPESLWPISDLPEWMRTNAGAVG